MTGYRGTLDHWLPLPGPSALWPEMGGVAWDGLD